MKAIVININNKKQIQILFGEKIITCLIPGSLASRRNSLAVGDEVEIAPAGSNQYKLIRILPRKAALYRGDRRSPGDEVLIAANAQYLLAIVTAEYLVNQTGFLETAVIAARRSGIEVGLMVSKWDLAGEHAQTLLRDKITQYHGIADAVFLGSAHERNEDLIQTVKGKTTVVIGDRGCGKTTVIRRIVSCLQGNDIDREKVPSTSASELYAAPEKTFLIDTPGFRDLALPQITADERDFVFPEIAKLTAACHFKDCTHVHEEGCQVRDALRTGSIKKERYSAYQKMAGVTPAPTNRKKAFQKLIIGILPVGRVLSAGFAAHLSFRTMPEVNTVIIAQNVCQASMWTTSRAIGPLCATVLWIRSAFGCARTENGRLFTDAGCAGLSVPIESQRMTILCC